MVKNALSVDLESFVHRNLNLKNRTKNDNGYTVSTTNYILDLFDKYDTKATFFVLGEIYEWYPKLIEEIKKRGHEIGYHGHRHVLISSKEILLEELNLSKKFLEKYRPIGFRAPRMFLKEELLKALEDFNFKYDSSCYGSKINYFKNYNIKEIPVSFFNYFPSLNQNKYFKNIDFQLLLKGVPFGSGLFISLLQSKIQNFIDISNRKGQNTVLFFHPWQLLNYDKIYLPLMQRFLYKRKINNVLEYLLKNNKFNPLKELL